VASRAVAAEPGPAGVEASACVALGLFRGEVRGDAVGAEAEDRAAIALRPDLAAVHFESRHAPQGQCRPRGRRGRLPGGHGRGRRAREQRIGPTWARCSTRRTRARREPVLAPRSGRRAPPALAARGNLAAVLLHKGPRWACARAAGAGLRAKALTALDGVDEAVDRHYEWGAQAAAAAAVIGRWPAYTNPPCADCCPVCAVQPRRSGHD